VYKSADHGMMTRSVSGNVSTHQIRASVQDTAGIELAVEVIKPEN